MNVSYDNIWNVKGWTPKQIATLREAAGMTQARFAEWLGVTRVHVAHMESGVRPAGVQTVRLLEVMAKLQSGKLKVVQPKSRKGASS